MGVEEEEGLRAGGNNSKWLGGDRNWRNYATMLTISQ